LFNQPARVIDYSTIFVQPSLVNQLA